MKRRRCNTTTRQHTTTTTVRWPVCVVCGQPVVTAGQDYSFWTQPDLPEANEHGIVYRHAQDGDVPSFRFDRKWGRERRKANPNQRDREQP